MARTPTTLYRLYDGSGSLLYVGITDNPSGRFTQHATEKVWWDGIATIRLEHYDDRQTALAAEALAIDTESPRHNLVGRPPDERQPGYRGWALPRGRCPYCGSDQALDRQGLLRWHKSADHREDGTISRYDRCPGVRRQAVAA